MITYILIGIFAITAALGGFRRMFEGSKINGIVAAVLLSLTALLQAVPPIKIAGDIFISLGGALLIVYAFVLVFYKSKIGAQLYTIYIALLLGLAFFAAERLIIGVEIATISKENFLIYAVFILAIMLFSPSPKAAFSISVLSSNFAAFIFYSTLKTPYIIGGGDTFNIAVILFVSTTVLSYYVKNAVQKLYPKPKEMFAETADEFAPDTDNSDKK